jgi:glycosyltransferase involved in cell wall biosynthesis
MTAAPHTPADSSPHSLARRVRAHAEPPAPVPAAQTLSIVVPTLNARARLPGCLGALRAARAAGAVDQVIVADGGSSDGTPEIARGHGAIVVAAGPGRGARLAAGAAAASGGWLLFLHPGTRLAPGWERALAAQLVEPGAHDTAWVFRLAAEEVSPAAERMAALANWRTHRLGLPAGEQGLLVARGLYRRSGGYRDIAVMEDVDLVRRIGRGRVRVLAATAVTGAAPYRRSGSRARRARSLAALGLHFLGAPPGLVRRLKD